MAKKSSIEKNERRRRMTKKFSSRRAKLKAIVHDKTLPVEDRFAATLKLAKLPRNSSATRIRNRCELPGRRVPQDRSLYPRLCRRGAGQRAQRARDRAEIFRRRAGDPRNRAHLQ